MLDWIFDGIISWVSKTVTKLMDAVSGLFLDALGTDMTAMEEYFPFVTQAFTIMQYTAWALLFIITIWKLFRSFGGPITEAENPWSLLGCAVLFALLIWFAKPIFLFVLEIAKAPYTALMDLTGGKNEFTFAGIEAVSSQRAYFFCIIINRCRLFASHHSYDCARLELFQTAVGGC